MLSTQTLHGLLKQVEASPDAHVTIPRSLARTLISQAITLTVVNANEADKWDVVQRMAIEFASHSIADMIRSLDPECYEGIPTDVTLRTISNNIIDSVSGLTATGGRAN